MEKKTMKQTDIKFLRLIIEEFDNIEDIIKNELNEYKLQRKTIYADNITVKNYDNDIKISNNYIKHDNDFLRLD